MNFPDLVVNVGQNPDTRKWHAAYDDPSDGSRMIGPPRDTEEEAKADQEEVVVIATRNFQLMGFNVSVRRGEQQ